MQQRSRRFLGSQAKPSANKLDVEFAYPLLLEHDHGLKFDALAAEVDRTGVHVETLDVCESQNWTKKFRKVISKTSTRLSRYSRPTRRLSLAKRPAGAQA